MTASKQQRAPLVLHGIGVSPGVVTGRAHVHTRKLTNVIERRLEETDVPKELCRLEAALIRTRGQIRGIQENLRRNTGMRDASVLDAHLMVLDDRSFMEEVVGEIRERRCNAEAVVSRVGERYAAVLASLNDQYLRERVVDVKDVARRIVHNLAGNAETELGDARPGKMVVVAEDLVPSETACMRRDRVLGFATEQGSPTSHTAVMARALEIPAVVGLPDVVARVRSGDEVLIDGNKGVLILHPSAEQQANYGRVAEARRSIQRELNNLRHEPAETRDGHRIVLSANTEGLNEVEAVLQYGAEGVGLFRSEYLFLAREGAVGEEEQAGVYTEIAERLAPAPVIIRTLDLGGDKYLASERRSAESNPFLGCRSIRMSLLHPDIFKSQLRAVLKASAVGNVKIMYPMVCTAEEVVRANEMLEECKDELRAAGVPFDENLEVGVMIEIPSAALTADTLAGHVQFFSLGTNDLIQYTLAVDRVNEKVAYLYQPTHPAVLKLIRMTIEAGHRRGIWVGLCGEMAADPLLTPLLVGLNVDELSVAPAAVPMVKDAVRSVSFERARALSEQALECRNAAEVLALCRRLVGEVAPELLELV